MITTPRLKLLVISHKMVQLLPEHGASIDMPVVTINNIFMTLIRLLQSYAPIKKTGISWLLSFLKGFLKAAAAILCFLK